MATKKQISAAAAALGHLGGKVGGLSTSKAKTKASRANGAKGGRPRTDGLKVLARHGELSLVQHPASGDKWIVDARGWQSVALHYKEVEAIMADPSLMALADLEESEGDEIFVDHRR